MAELVANSRTTLPPDEVIIRSVQFFTSENWRTQTQSERIATFVGKPKIGCWLVVATIIGFLFFIIPGIILYLFIIRRAYAFQNIVVTANPAANGSEVVITHSPQVTELVSRFLGLLPTAPMG